MLTLGSVESTTGRPTCARSDCVSVDGVFLYFQQFQAKSKKEYVRMGSSFISLLFHYFVGWKLTQGIHEEFGSLLYVLFRVVKVAKGVQASYQQFHLCHTFSLHQLELLSKQSNPFISCITWSGMFCWSNSEGSITTLYWRIKLEKWISHCSKPITFNSFCKGM